MSQRQIAVIAGSIRRETCNRWLLPDVFAKVAPPAVVFKQFRSADLPLCNQDDDDHRAAPARRLKAAVAAGHGTEGQDGADRVFEPGRR